MFLIEFLPPRPHTLWTLAKQMGVTHCVIKAAPELTGLPPPWEPGVLEQLQRDLAAAGLTLVGLEGDPFDMSRIKFGLPGRDEDLAHYRTMLAEMGRLGLRLLCYNFMAGIGWHRSQAAMSGRGGALVSEFSLTAEPPGVTAAGWVSAEIIWANYVEFLRSVLPAAKAAGVRLGAHPDDPPLPILRGIGRIFHKATQFDHVLALDPSREHGLTFCQANWKLMCGSDSTALAAQARRYASADRIHFVHLRHVSGSAAHFVETFHDEGAVELISMLRVYHDAGFRGPVRCDHVPTMAGEDPTNHVPGYGTLGRLFANGYLLGLMDALGVRTTPTAWIES